MSDQIKKLLIVVIAAAALIVVMKYYRSNRMCCLWNIYKKDHHHNHAHHHHGQSHEHGQIHHDHHSNIHKAKQAQGNNQASDEWAEAVFVIKEVKKEGGGGYSYKVQYDCPESTAVNKKGEPIKGPIEQYVSSEKMPKEKQKLKGRYRKDEPIVFEIQDKIEYQEDK